VLLFVAVAGVLRWAPWDSTRGSALEFPPSDSYFQVKQDNAKANSPYSFGGMRTCVLGEATEAVVVRVELVNPQGGVQLTAWSVHLIAGFPPAYLGAENKALRELGWPVGGRQMVARCPGGPSKLAVELRKPTNKWAGASAVKVFYRIGDRQAEGVFNFALVLCEAEADSKTIPCPDLIPKNTSG